jgi:uncharacterized membrane protein YhaH (DUF805 family)
MLLGCGLVSMPVGFVWILLNLIPFTEVLRNQTLVIVGLLLGIVIGFFGLLLIQDAAGS